RFVWSTCRLGLDPPDFYTKVVPDLPAIVAMWHGQHFMMPFLKRKEHLVKVLISRHRDGEINAIAASRLGVEPIRGSGTSGRDFLRKGGVTGFRQMLEALAQGYNVALTADIPKIARVAGRGIVELARASGRPIYPVAVATSRYVELRSWDRSALNLPFGRFVIAVGEPIRVAADADAAALEDARRVVEKRLNATTDRAYAIAEGRAQDFVWGRGAAKTARLA
ncbi:MAG: lysophospholipid acyltransferase family protein, partial [Xanthobacteraceae bacterium]